MCWSLESSLEVPNVRTFRRPSGEVPGTTRAGWVGCLENSGQETLTQRKSRIFRAVNRDLEDVCLKRSNNLLQPLNGGDGLNFVQVTKTQLITGALSARYTKQCSVNLYKLD